MGRDAFHIIIVALTQIHLVDVHQAGDGVQHGTGTFKAGFQHVGGGLQAGEDGAQYLQQLRHITGRQCCHGYMNL